MEKLVNQRFGRLLVKHELSPRIRQSNSRTRKDRRFLCSCDCGSEKIIFMNELKNGDTVSCGCFHKEISSKTASNTFTAHGKSKSKLYRVWADMKSRCNNPNHNEFHNYGARGIEVCKAWAVFGTFEAWAITNGYTKGLEIDRIDNNLNYTPSNCRWVTRVVNCNNQRKTIIIDWEGEKISLSDLCRSLGLSRTRVYQRLKRDGMSIEDAVSLPYRNYSKLS